MKRGMIILVLILLTLPLYSAQNLYQQDSLLLRVSLDSQFTLTPSGSSPSVEDVSANLFLYPTEDFRQKIVKIDSAGTANNNSLTFKWKDGQIGAKQYGYNAVIQTNNQQLPVKDKIAYPLTDHQVQGLEEYLKPTKTIDSDNPNVIAKASELAEGETDLFKVAFKLSSWVEENINYDLNSVTATASLPASWVLQHREGVCDEMTSLFVAMARSLGIPARFVSGISYSTSKLFDKPWQPHGWGEIYIPNVGWVAFDITFGEYGYIDVTHIKLRDGFDPAEPATKFEWLAHDVQLKPDQLNYDVSIAKTGLFVPEKIQLTEEILAPEVGSGSYNLIKGILKNSEDYYAATTLTLAVPKEIDILGRNKRTILLSPKEVRETYWIIKAPENLPENAIYTFPSVIYSEKNISVIDSFQVLAGKITYSKDDVDKLTITNEEKTYSRKITFNCQYPSEIKVGDEAKITCAIRNQGTANLHDLKFCLSSVCETIDLPLNQEQKSEITIKGETAGEKKVVITAENPDVEKKAVIEYRVVDEPKISVDLVGPSSLSFNQVANLKITVGKASFSTPQNVRVTLTGDGFNNLWEIVTLEKTTELPLEISNLALTTENKFTVDVIWSDQTGKEYVTSKTITISGEAHNFSEKVKMFIHKLGKWFS